MKTGHEQQQGTWKWEGIQTSSKKQHRFLDLDINVQVNKLSLEETCLEAKFHPETVFSS